MFCAYIHTHCFVMHLVVFLLNLGILSRGSLNCALINNMFVVIDLPKGW